MSALQEKNSVFVVIAAFNESASLQKVVRELLAYGYTIVVVDDGSAQRMHQYLDGLRSVYCIRHKVNLGQGAALQTGIQFALGKGAACIVTFDADGQHAAADIENLLAPLVSGEAEVTMGSRFLKPGLHNASLLRKWVLQVARVINFLFTGFYLSDAHNGLRAMTAAAAKKIHLKENRMAHATEFLLAIKKNRLSWKEVPATVIYTEYSKKKGQSVFNSIRIFFDLVLHKLFE
jgi:polyprenyl-phospho-N-acetylgalactosaminyl synthase